MADSVRHIAIFVPDLEGSEAYYRHLFDMEIVGRETLLEDGLWYTLPADKGWVDARGAGIELGVVALRRGEFVLALFPGDAQLGQLYLIGLTMSPDAIDGVRERLLADAEVLEDRPGALMLRDRNLIVWQIYVTGTEFQTSGESGGRWLDL